MVNTVIANAIPELTALDRCDVCQAQARVGILLTDKNEFPLLFCGHHFLKNEEYFFTTAYAILDERGKLNE